MARRRRSRREHRKMDGIKHFAPAAVGLAAFLEQITEKDVAFAQANNSYPKDALSQVKFIAGNAIGRVTGFYPFPDVTGTHPFSIKPENAINKWVGLGIGAMAYSAVPKMLGIKSLPHAALAKKAGGELIFGGVLGGIFDDKVSDSLNKSVNYNVSNPASVNRGMGSTGLSM